MSDTTKDTVEPVTPPETTAETPKVEVPAVEKPKEPTVSELLETKKPDVPQDVVPLATHLETKKEVKELRKSIKDLEEKVKQGAPKVEITEDIAALGTEFGVDATFLARLSSALTSKAKTELAAETEAALQPLRDKDKQAKIDEAFTLHFGKAMETMPEYEKVVNPDIIKTLSLDPRNANKTFAELIEETYGNAVTGKRTIETTTPGGGKDNSPLDYQRAVKDPEYFKEVMNNPTLKKEYNDKMLKSGF